MSWLISAPHLVGIPRLNQPPSPLLWVSLLTRAGVGGDERRKMKVKIEFTVETTDFGEAEFKKEIEALIKDIDRDTELLNFSMQRVED